MSIYSEKGIGQLDGVAVRGIDAATLFLQSLLPWSALLYSSDVCVYTDVEFLDWKLRPSANSRSFLDVAWPREFFAFKKLYKVAQRETAGGEV